MPDPRPTHELVDELVDHQIMLAEQVRLPEYARRAALDSMLDLTQIEVHPFDGEQWLEAHRIAEAGYQWARERKYVAFPSDAGREFIDLVTDGVGEDTLDLAWTNVARLCLKCQTTFQAEFPNETIDGAIRLQLRDVSASQSEAVSQALARAFLDGASVCAAEKQIVVALDWQHRLERVRRAQRWDWLRWRTLRWHWLRWRTRR